VPGERELWGRVSSDIVAYRRTIARVLAAVDRGDHAAARALVRGELRAAVDTTSADMSSDIELNGKAADADGRFIGTQRRRSLEAALVLALASVVFTTIVAVLVYRLAAPVATSSTTGRRRPR